MSRIFALALAGLALLVVLGVPEPPEAEPSMRRGGEPSMRPEHGKGSHDVHGVKAPKVKHFYRHRNRHARSHPHGSGV